MLALPPSTLFIDLRIARQQEEIPLEAVAAVIARGRACQRMIWP